jgi:hypothetical protein
VPFLGTNYLSVISQVLNDTPKSPRELRPELSEEFEAIVLKALEKDKAGRYQTTEEIIADLSALSDDPTHSTERARITGPRRKPLARRGGRALIFVAGAGLVVGAAVIAVVTMMRGSNQASGKNANAPDAAGALAGLTPDARPGSPDAAPAADRITFKIVSSPKGAMVYEGSRQLGPTPYDYIAPLNDEKITLVAHLDGYDDAEFYIIPTIDKDRVKNGVMTVTLHKPKKGTGPVIKIKPGNGTGTGSGNSGNGGGSGASELGHNPYPR